MNEELIAEIAVPPLGTPLTYLVPEHLSSLIRVGHAVSIPLGRRSGQGFVVKLQTITNKKQFKFALKPLTSIIRTHQFFIEAQMEWFKWIANYYGDSLAAVLDTAIPTPPTEQFRELITKVIVPATTPRGAKTQELLKFLSESNLPLDVSMVARRFSSAKSVIKKLQLQGTLEICTEEITHSVKSARLSSNRPDNLILTPAQQKSISIVKESLDAEEFRTYLLHGVTGSGKTEVYLELAEHALKNGKSVLILVPEIALTPQLIGRFEERLKEPVAVLHSAVHKRARWEAWRSLVEGRSRVGLGARSAVFAPLRSLGLIVIDEEHDSSYKQNEGIRYHGRDLAVMRGKFENCPVILGSATPSLESWINAHQKKYRYLSLPERPLTRAQATIEMIDLGKIKAREMPSKTISPRLFELLTETLARKEQAFILYNRRGFASYLQCQLCAKVINCPNCSVALTLHQDHNTLLCHYCGVKQVPPKHCSICPMPNPVKADPKESEIPLMVERGAGTERAVEELEKLFPGVKIERLDRDAASTPEELLAILNRVKNGECQLLVGTQMIAKGHDVPNVTLVGVLDSDIGLHMPDFRSAERVFHLLTQVAGRAGRGDLAGRVVLQTRLPQHAVLKSALADNYLAFAKFELAIRQPIGYPPFGKLLRIVCTSSEHEKAKKISEQIAAMVHNSSKSENNDVVCLGPAPAPFERLRGNFRYHLLLKSQSASTLSSYSKRLKQAVGKLCSGTNKNIRVIFDLDPQDML